MSGNYGEVVRFSTTNSQSDGHKSLKRMEFEFLGSSYEFNVNPEEYQQTEPSRITVTQTKGGAWMDDFGSGVVKIVMKGTTGFKSNVLDENQRLFLDNLIKGKGGNSIWAVQEYEREMVGFYKFKQLRDLIRTYYGAYKPGDPISSDKELTLHNHTDGEHWVVAPETFDLFRSISRPLLYSYNISLWALRPANTPAYSSDTGGIGRISGLIPTWKGDW